MKKLFTAVPIFILVFACNNSADNNSSSTDSLQYLLQTIRDSIKKNPDNPKPKYNLAIVLQDAGMYKEAVLALDSMNISLSDSVNPRMYFDYLFKRSELLILAADTTEAIKTLELFVMPGELTQAGLRLANLYAETNNPKAVSFCDEMKANDKTGTDPNPDFLKGIYYYNTGDFQKALHQFDESIRRDYNFIDAYLEKGTIFYKQKKYDDAIKALDLALQISPGFADAFYWKAKSQLAIGKKDEARLNFQRAYGLDKTLTEAKSELEKL